MKPVSKIKFLVIVTAIAAFAGFLNAKSPVTVASPDIAEKNRVAGPENKEGISLVKPVAEFEKRIAKKHFGLYVTPETSPVSPDKFTGYHNGVDVEYGDVEEDVPVHAAADGEIVFRGWAGGYGGVVVLKHDIRGETYFSLYGHLDPDSLPGKDTVSVNAGEFLGLLGNGYSHETDGARKHLHFSVRRNGEPDIRGYVHTESDLLEWVDPLEFY